MSEVKNEGLEVVAWVLLNEKGRTEEILPYAPTASDVQPYWPEPIQLCRHSEALAGYAVRDAQIAELEGLLRHAQKQVPTGSGLHMRIDAALAAHRSTGVV